MSPRPPARPADFGTVTTTDRLTAARNRIDDALAGRLSVSLAVYCARRLLEPLDTDQPPARQ